MATFNLPYEDFGIGMQAMGGNAYGRYFTAYKANVPTIPSGGGQSSSNSLYDSNIGSDFVNLCPPGDRVWIVHGIRVSDTIRYSYAADFTPNETLDPQGPSGVVGKSLTATLSVMGADIKSSYSGAANANQPREYYNIRTVTVNAGNDLVLNDKRTPIVVPGLRKIRVTCNVYGGFHAWFTILDIKNA
jgi:hypothetical protein